MKPNYGTRRCHNCDRHSWLVAKGEACPWCAKKTHRHHDTMGHVMALISIVSMLAVAYALSKM